MSDASTKTCLKVPEASAQLASNPEVAEESERLRRSERTRTLTEKGKEMQDQILKKVRRQYKIMYEKWRYHARIGKEMLADQASESELEEFISHMESACSDMMTIYEELRRSQIPEPELIHVYPCQHL